MKVPCASCGRQLPSASLRKRGAFLVCELCRFMLDNGQCEFGKKPRCWICREELAVGEVVIHDGRVFCSGCVAELVSLKKSVAREEIGVFSSTDELWLEVSLWRMIIESALSGDTDAAQTQNTNDPRAAEPEAGDDCVCQPGGPGVGDQAVA